MCMSIFKYFLMWFYQRYEFVCCYQLTQILNVKILTLEVVIKKIFCFDDGYQISWVTLANVIH